MQYGTKTGRFFAVLSLILWTGVLSAEENAGSIRFGADCARSGEKIGNKASNINLWRFQSLASEQSGEGADLRPFVEYVQFMQATGSSPDRDLFKNPADLTVLDDYRFEPLGDACAKVLAFGAKPHIKMSVPGKYAPNGSIGDFSTNVYPPDDFALYQRYIAAMTRYLVERFGVDEVKTWRFGVLTEFENPGWFKARSGSADESRQAYFKLYDHTVAALVEEIGPDVFVGAHAMACVEGLWDERDLLDHCASGTNEATGKVGTPIRFFACSYYDVKPGSPNQRGLVAVIDAIRQRANEVGLTDLIYGVDEGRILYGVHSGTKAADLTARTVGRTYQAAFDARLYKQMTDHNIDYFSAWSHSSGEPYCGYPTVGYYVAKYFAEFKNARSVPVETLDSALAEQVEVGAVVGVEPETVHVMMYNFKDDWDYDGQANAALELTALVFAGQQVEITETIIDDTVNYFVQWEKDSAELAPQAQFGSWSPDDPSLDSSLTLLDETLRQTYETALRSRYVEIANSLKSTVSNLTVPDNGKITLAVELPRQAVVFYAIKPMTAP